MRLFCLVAVVALVAIPTTSLLGQSVEEFDSEEIEIDSPPRRSDNRVDASDVATKIIQQTNDFRRSHGLKSLDASPKLNETADYFSDYMARTNKYGHAADGRRPSTRATDRGYAYCLVSENIAYQYDSTGFTVDELARRFVEGWKQSAGHRENMLDPDAIETGVSVARSDETGIWYADQMFGRPESATIEFRISNETDKTINYDVGDRSFDLPSRYTRTHLRCRTTGVDFSFANHDAKASPIDPTDGDRYVVEQIEGELAVRKNP